MIEINALGDNCPIPVIKAKKALQTITEGSILISVDNKIATENLAKLANEFNCAVDVTTINQDHFEVKIIKGEDTSLTEEKEDLYTTTNTVVSISSDKMGQGDDVLGKTLIKMFIYTLSEMEKLPSKIIFYNSGVQLVVEGSESLEDLHKLSDRGVEILACGACLNYYKLSEKLAIGSTTNMSDILDHLSNADKIIKP